MSLESMESELRSAHELLRRSTAVAHMARQQYIETATATLSARLAARIWTSPDEPPGPLPTLKGTPAPSTNSGSPSDGALSTVASLAASFPWALASFEDPIWNSFEPATDAPLPVGLRIGSIARAGFEGIPSLPAVARFFGHGHIFVLAQGVASAKTHSLLQAMTLRLATATNPGTIRFAFADPAGQGRNLSGFLRLPQDLRMGNAVAVSRDDIAALLMALNGHVVAVTQHRLANVYESLIQCNSCTTGLAIPYHILVLADFPTAMTERSADLLLGLARNGPRAGVHIIATIDPDVALPGGFDLAALTSIVRKAAL